MRRRKKRFLDHKGMTLMEVTMAFFILMLVSKAFFACVSGYSYVIKRSQELSAAAVRLEHLAGDMEYGNNAEIHLEVGGEEFVEPGAYVEETGSDSGCVVSGFWINEAAMEELFTDEE